MGFHDNYGTPQSKLVRFLSDQTLNVTESLKLGVRAFDVRPWNIPPLLQMRHSHAHILFDLSTVFSEISSWFNQLPSGSEELVVVNPQFMHEDDKSASKQAVFKLARETFNFTVYTNEDCDAFNDAIKSRIHGVIVIDSCINGWYLHHGNHPYVACSGGEDTYIWPANPSPPKCSLLQQARLLCYMEGFSAANQGPGAAIMQAHQQGMQAVATENTYNVNAQVARKLRDIGSDLSRRPFFIQIDNAAHDGDLVANELSAIRHLHD